MAATRFASRNGRFRPLPGASGRATTLTGAPVTNRGRFAPLGTVRFCSTTYGTAPHSSVSWTEPSLPLASDRARSEHERPAERPAGIFAGTVQFRQNQQPNSGGSICEEGARGGRAGVEKGTPAALVGVLEGGGERHSFLRINFVPGWL